MNTIKTLISNLTQNQQSSSVEFETRESLCNYEDDYYGDQRCNSLEHENQEIVHSKQL